MLSSQKKISVSVRNLQKDIENSLGDNNKNKFVPFLQERRLGKLLPKNGEYEKLKDKKLGIMDINFRNFKKIYRREKIIQDVRYSQLTRNSEQPDLISHRSDWKINHLKSEKTLKNKSQLHNQRSCCVRPKSLERVKQNKFDKIDEEVYKKISVSKPPEGLKNSQTERLFKRYVEVCELNENIRRLELTRKKKW